MPRIGRRTVLAGAIGAAAVPVRASADAPTPGQPRDRNRLWYRQPAIAWTEALPVGNGHVGAMIFGGIAQERLQLNHNRLSAGAPYQADNPDALEALPRVRALIDAGQYAQAEALAGARMMGRPLTQMPYGALGDLLIDFDNAAPPDHYTRALDIGDALATVDFSRAGTRHRRTLFASAPANLLVLTLESSPAPLSFRIGYRGARRETVYPDPDPSGAPRPADWLHRIAPGHHEAVTIAPDGPAALLITGRNTEAAGIPAGLTWAVRVQLVGDARIKQVPGGLTVEGGSTISLLIAADTSYVRFDDVSNDPVAGVRAATAAAAGRRPAALRRAHVADHRSLFDRFDLDLGSGPADIPPTDARIAAMPLRDDPGLAALYTQYGRYLLIACSRPGGQPANLQGMWNEGLDPPWGCKYTININTQMNYWPAGPTGLDICAEPLLAMVEDLAITGARTARTMYGADGWVAHHNVDLWRATAPVDGPQWGLWPCGGAWLCNTLWDVWDHSRNPDMLRRLYPLLAGASRFFLSTLVPDPGGRGLVTSPSISPENMHPFGAAVCAGPAMDRQIIRDLFAHTVAAATLLDQDAELRARIALAGKELAPDRIGAQGQLQEWLDDWDAAAPEQDHRHVSHLYAVYPGAQINPRDTPALLAAAKVSLDVRGDLSTGWATAWRACLRARMGDAARAHAILRGLMGPQRSYPNMFDAHPPFQIDGNFGGAAAVAEMIAQSWGDDIRLLPALPDGWNKGHVRGLKLRGGLTLDMRWSNGSVESFTLRGPPGSTHAVYANGRRQNLRLDSRGHYRGSLS